MPDKGRNTEKRKKRGIQKRKEKKRLQKQGNDMLKALGEQRDEERKRQTIAKFSNEQLFTVDAPEETITEDVMMNDIHKWRKLEKEKQMKKVEAELKPQKDKFVIGDDFIEPLTQYTSQHVPDPKTTEVYHVSKIIKDLSKKDSVPVNTTSKKKATLKDLWEEDDQTTTKKTKTVKSTSLSFIMPDSSQSINPRTEEYIKGMQKVLENELREADKQNRFIEKLEEAEKHSQHGGNDVLDGVKASLSILNSYENSTKSNPEEDVEVKDPVKEAQKQLNQRLKQMSKTKRNRAWLIMKKQKMKQKLKEVRQMPFDVVEEEINNIEEEWKQKRETKKKMQQQFEQFKKEHSIKNAVYDSSDLPIHEGVSSKLSQVKGDKYHIFTDLLKSMHSSKIVQVPQYNKKQI